MEFLWVLKKELVKIPGSVKKEVEFPGVIKKRCGIFMGLGFWPWNFQGVSHNFVEFPRVKLPFFWNFQGKMTNPKHPDFFFEKSMSSLPSLTPITPQEVIDLK